MARKRSAALFIVLFGLIGGAGTGITLLLTGEGSASAGPVTGGKYRVARSVRTAVPAAAGSNDPGASPAPPSGGPRPAAPNSAAPVPSATRAGVEVIVTVFLNSDHGVAPPGAEVILLDSAALWSGVADEEGKVRFRGVAAGRVHVVARATCLVGLPAMYTVMEGQPAELRAFLFRPNAVEGRVTARASGEPVAGARVQVLLPFEVPPEMWAATWESTTDAAGRFRLEGVPSTAQMSQLSGAMRLGAFASGFAPAVSEPFHLNGWYPPGKVETIDLALEKSGRIVGTVRDGENRPVAGAFVCSVPRARPGGKTTPPQVFRSSPFTTGAPCATTGADGAYALEDVGMDVIQWVTATRAGFVAAGAGREAFLNAAAPEARCDLTLVPAGALLVEWAPETGPMPAVDRLTVDVRAGDSSSDSISGGVGTSHRFASLAAGPRVVTVEAPGVGSGEAPVVVPAGGEAKVHVVLHAGEGIGGIVVDAAGNPVPGAAFDLFGPFRTVQEEAEVAGPRITETPGVPVLVALKGMESGTFGWQPGRAAIDCAHSDASGRFLVGGLRSGRRYRIRARAPGFGQVMTHHVESPASDVRIEMAATGAVTGRLTLPPGATPPASVTLQFRSAGPSGDAEDRMLRGVTGFGDGPNRDGTFRLADLPSGPGTLVATGGLLRGALDIDVPAGGTADIGAIPLDSGLHFRVRVLDSRGLPLPLAKGEALAMLERRGGTSLVDGTMDFGRIPAGSAVIQIYAEGYLPLRRRVAVKEDAPPEEFVLQRGGILRGTARDASGAPCYGWIARFVPLGDRAAETPSRTGLGLRGEFRRTLPAGPYRVEILRPGGGTDVAASAEATVEEGREVSVDVTLP